MELFVPNWMNEASRETTIYTLLAMNKTRSNSLMTMWILHTVTFTLKHRNKFKDFPMKTYSSDDMFCDVPA